MSDTAPATGGRSKPPVTHTTELDPPISIYNLLNACSRCRDCFHPHFGPNTDDEPCDWCQDCACPSADHVVIDRHGDVWTPGQDGLWHTPETAPFSREHIVKKWGPLRFYRAGMD